MSWTMPHRVLQIVATLIVLAAATSFTLGVLNAPQRGRLPGQKTSSAAAVAGQPVDAVDATPLAQARIEGPPPPPPKAEAKPNPEEQVEDEGSDEDQAGNTPTISLPPPGGNAFGAAAPPLGNATGNATAPLDEPPH